MGDNPPRRKLPVFLILRESYRVFFENTPIFLRLIPIPVLVTLVGNVVVTFPYENSGLNTFVLYSALIFEILFFICYVPAITAWHRLIIKNPEDEHRRVHYSFGAEELIFIRRNLTILITILFFSAVVGILAIMLTITLDVSLGYGLLETMWHELLIFFVIITALFLFPRFLLVLPAAAIGRFLKLSESSAYSKGNKLRLGVLYGLAIAPQLILSTLFDKFFTWWLGEDHVYIAGISTLFQSIVMFVFFTISVGVLSFAYMVLAENREYQKPE